MSVSYANVKEHGPPQQRAEKRSRNARGTGMVGVTGIGPVTSSLSGTRSNQLSYTPWCGGGSGIRTRDFQLAKLALCQLSYAPGGFRLGQRPAGLPPLRPRERQGKPRTTCVRLRPVTPLPGPPAAFRQRANVHIPQGRPRGLRGILLRKEVIQPLVPQRLPCYDFIPVTNRTLDASLPCGSVRRLRVQSAPMM